MDSSDKYKVSEQDAAVWTLIHKLIRAAHGDPFEASRRVAELISPILDKAEKWDRVEDTHEFKFVRHIESHLSGNQVPICTICGKTIFEIALEGKEV